MAAPPLDLRTYLLLERAFVRRLTRTWQMQSAPTYTKITQACLDHKWDEARRLVPDLDLAEVGTVNKEWIQYMLLSFAVFGAGTVSRKKPSFVGVGSFDTFLKQVTTNFLRYLELTATAQVQAEAMRKIAEDEAHAQKREWDPSEHPRGKDGKFRFFHGTGADRLHTILHEGLTLSHAGEVWPNFSQKDKTYIAGDEEEAASWAQRTVEMQAQLRIMEERDAEEAGTPIPHQEPPAAALLTVEIPESELSKLTPDRHFLDETQHHPEKVPDKFEFAGEIKPEWIVRAQVLVTPSTIASFYKNPEWVDVPVPAHKGEGRTIYIAVLLTDGPVQKWDEAKHPRDKEGQFAKAGTGRPGIMSEYREATDSDMAGGGPIRAQWVKLNEEAMEAFDAELDAKTILNDVKRQVENFLTYHRVTGNREYALDPDPRGDAADPNQDYVKEKNELHVTLSHASKTWMEASSRRRKAEDALKAIEPAMKVEVITNLSTDVARRMGVDPSLIEVVHQDPRRFKVGDKDFTEAGHFNPNDGRIQLNAAVISYGNDQSVKGITAHEISHLVYKALKDQADREFNQYINLAIDPDTHEHSAWYHERFIQEPGKMARQVRPEKREELAKMFPAAAVLAGLAGGDIFTGVSSEMVAADGHSAYSRSYWEKEAVAAAGHTYESAINETMAEVTRWITYPGGWTEVRTPHPRDPWVQVVVQMHKWYAEHQERIKIEEARLAEENNRILKDLEARS